MSRLRLALGETKQELGLNLPTAISAFLAIAVTIAIHSNFSAPDLDSVSRFALWLAESLGWALAVACVFLPLLGINLVRIGRRQRAVDASLKQAAELGDSVDEQVKLFLRNSLSGPGYNVVSCYAFGSVVRQHATRDVDVVVQFGSSDPSQVRSDRRRLRDVERTCEQVYRLKLHLQTFLQNEDDALLDFLHKAGDHEKLI